MFMASQFKRYSIKDFFSKCDQIRSFLLIWLHLLKTFLMENFIFCAVAESWYRYHKLTSVGGENLVHFV